MFSKLQNRLSSLGNALKKEPHDPVESDAAPETAGVASPVLVSTGVPSGIKIQGETGSVRMNKRALYSVIAIACAVAIAGYALRPSKVKDSISSSLKTAEVAGDQSWYQSKKDYFVGEKEIAAAKAADAARAATLPGQTASANSQGVLPTNIPLMPPPPMGSMGSGAPALLAQGSNNGSLLNGGAGWGNALDVRTSKMPMVAWRAGGDVPGAAQDRTAGNSFSRMQAQAQGGNPASSQTALNGATAQNSVLPPRALQPSLTKSAGVGQGVAQVSPYELKAGWVIPGVLLSGINSDVPGMLLGQVAENVFDTTRSEHLLIPAGARLIGTYAAKPSYGTERLQVSWVRLILPDGMEYDLSGMGGSDASGQAGLTDQVNNHYGKLISTAMLMSVFGVQAQMLTQQNQTTNGQVNVGSAMAASVGTQVNNTAQSMLQRDIAVAPTLNIRAGYRFSIMVSKNIVFNQPYKAAAYR